MSSRFKDKDITTVADLSREDLLTILDATEEMKHRGSPNRLEGRVLASCFFEPSTRTRLSFETAMLRMGGRVISLTDMEKSSVKKGEGLYDTMKMLEAYADLVVIRHPLEGASQLAADAVSIPVVNAGDGANQHPTQTLLDLFSIRETQGTLDRLQIGLAGDLKYGRTVHSLAQALIHFKPRLYFLSPEELEMPKELCEMLREQGVKFSFHRSFEEIIPKLDILYMTRVQEERLPGSSRLNGQTLKRKHLDEAKDNLKVLHPLPRLQEIEAKVDSTPFAYYFEQAKNGVYARQALLALILGEEGNR